jgi:undecaprenyl-diphosphatase
MMLDRRRGISAFCAAFVIVFAVGVSRIYLGYHYFSDVLGGYSAGLFWLLISVTAGLGRRRAHTAPSKGS